MFCILMLLACAAAFGTATTPDANTTTMPDVADLWLTERPNTKFIKEMTRTITPNLITTLYQYYRVHPVLPFIYAAEYDGMAPRTGVILSALVLWDHFDYVCPRATTNYTMKCASLERDMNMLTKHIKKTVPTLLDAYVTLVTPLRPLLHNEGAYYHNVNTMVIALSTAFSVATASPLYLSPRGGWSTPVKLLVDSIESSNNNVLSPTIIYWLQYFNVPALCHLPACTLLNNCKILCTKTWMDALSDISPEALATLHTLQPLSRSVTLAQLNITDEIQITRYASSADSHLLWQVCRAWMLDRLVGYVVENDLNIIDFRAQFNRAVQYEFPEQKRLNLLLSEHHRCVYTLESGVTREIMWREAVKMFNKEPPAFPPLWFHEITSAASTANLETAPDNPNSQSFVCINDHPVDVTPRIVIPKVCYWAPTIICNVKGHRVTQNIRDFIEGKAPLAFGGYVWVHHRNLTVPHDPKLPCWHALHEYCRLSMRHGVQPKLLIDYAIFWAQEDIVMHHHNPSKAAASAPVNFWPRKVPKLKQHIGALPKKINVRNLAHNCIWMPALWCQLNGGARAGAPQLAPDYHNIAIGMPELGLPFMGALSHLVDQLNDVGTCLENTYQFCLAAADNHAIHVMEAWKWSLVRAERLLLEKCNWPLPPILSKSLKIMASGLIPFMQARVRPINVSTSNPEHHYYFHEL